VRENKRVTRYYHTNTTTKESSIIGSIRSCNTRRIILSAILKHTICTFRQIVELTSRAPSTVLWHIRRLERANIIAVQKRNGGQYNRKHLLYELNDMESTASILSKFRLLSHMDTKNSIERFRPQLVQWS
jgi:DNA-binding transcriptional ArsR family regulator